MSRSCFSFTTRERDIDIVPFYLENPERPACEIDTESFIERGTESFPFYAENLNVEISRNGSKEVIADASAYEKRPAPEGFCDSCDLRGGTLAVKRHWIP